MLVTAWLCKHPDQNIICLSYWWGSHALIIIILIIIIIVALLLWHQFHRLSFWTINVQRKWRNILNKSRWWNCASPLQKKQTSLMIFCLRYNTLLSSDENWKWIPQHLHFLTCLKPEPLWACNVQIYYHNQIIFLDIPKEQVELPTTQAKRTWIIGLTLQLTMECFIIKTHQDHFFTLIGCHIYVIHLPLVCSCFSRWQHLLGQTK